MLDALPIVLHHAGPECRLVDDLANVLKNKVVGLQVLVCSQAETLLVRLDDRNVGILLALEPLVLAPLSAIGAIYTLYLGGSVDAV